MLASRLPGILPPMTEQEALEAATVASVSQVGLDLQRWAVRSFRAPHHTASSAALVGGGSQPRPGEISLAHHGVLFLDELPEFNRNVLEVLREPLEPGRILISRAARQAEFPADFQLVAAMNPCPCGYFGSSLRNCKCTPGQVARYLAKVSGPLVDRIDIHIEVPAVPYRNPDNYVRYSGRLAEARQLLVDPGIGFGKPAPNNAMLLRRLAELVELVFMGTKVGLDGRDARETLCRCPAGSIGCPARRTALAGGRGKVDDPPSAPSDPWLAR